MAAYLSSALSLHDAVLLVKIRSQVMAKYARSGAMLVVHSSIMQIPPLPQTCEIAVENSRRQIVVAGSLAEIEKYQLTLTEKKISHTLLPVAHGFHSQLVAECLPPFEAKLQQSGIRYLRPALPYFSSLTGSLHNESLDQHYWQDHMRQSVRFSDACQSLLNHKYGNFIELGPEGILSRLMQQNHKSGTDIQTFSAGAGRNSLLPLLMFITRSGCEINWVNWYKTPQNRLTLPVAPYKKTTMLHPALTASMQVSTNINTPVLSKNSTLYPEERNNNMNTVNHSGNSDTTQILALCQQQLQLLSHSLNGASSGYDNQPNNLSSLSRGSKIEIRETNNIDADIDSVVLQSISSIIGIDVNKLNPTKILTSELGMDSLMLATLRSRLLDQLPSLAKLPLNEQSMFLGANQTAYGLINTLKTHLYPNSGALNQSKTAEHPITAQSVLKPTHTNVTPEWEIECFGEVVDLHRRLEQFGKNNPYFRVHEQTNGCMSRIQGQDKIHFASYNYLGLSGLAEINIATCQAVSDFGTSVSASRPISGERKFHQDLEHTIASLLGCDDAIVMLGGHATNETVIGHIVAESDLIIYDSLAHNSIVQGTLMSGAHRRSFPHNDYAALDKMLTEIRQDSRRVLIVVEGVYSMDGDIADIPQLIAAKKKHRCLLMVDEAHSIGTIGDTGRGVGEYFNIQRQDVDIWMGTLSKAFASCGGYIAGNKSLITYLKYTTPGFIFSVGMTPANAAAAQAAIEYMINHPKRVSQLGDNAKSMRLQLQKAGINIGNSQNTPIIPVIIGHSEQCIKLAERLFQAGINVNPIVYPAVDENQARLRFFITTNHNKKIINRTVSTLVTEMKELGLM